MSILRRYLKKISIIGLLYRFGKKRITRSKHLLNKLFTRKITKRELMSQFKQIGLNPGDNVIINSSMSSMGILENGPRTIVEAFKEYITKKGLIVMSTYPHTNSFDYLENYEVFDVNNTPSKNGAISEYFRKSKDVFRSTHPTHSLAAWGKNAKQFMLGHENSSSPYDQYSPYKKLLDINVKILLIGVNFNHAVMIRIIDDLYKDYPLNPYIPGKIYSVSVKDHDGKNITVKTPCHDPKFSRERNNMAVFPYVKDKITFGKLGSANTWVLNSQDLFNKQVELSKKGIFPFYQLPLKNRN